MIVISLVLVVVSAVSLLVGGLFRDDLVLIWVSIGAALAAAAFLGAGVLRGTRRRKPVKAATLPGEDAAGRPATWQGAGWGGTEAAGGEPGGGEALGREEEEVSFVEATPVTTIDDREAAETTRLDDAAYAPTRTATPTEGPAQAAAPAQAAVPPQAPAPAQAPAPPQAPAPTPQPAWAPPAPPKPATPPPAPAVPPPAPPAVRHTPTPPPPPAG